MEGEGAVVTGLVQDGPFAAVGAESVGDDMIEESGWWVDILVDMVHASAGAIDRGGEGVSAGGVSRLHAPWSVNDGDIKVL